MANESEKNLVFVSAELIRTEVGHRFLAALRDYVVISRDALVKAPPEWLHHAQGQARGLTVLLEKIETSVETAEKMAAAAATKQARNP